MTNAISEYLYEPTIFACAGSAAALMLNNSIGPVGGYINLAATALALPIACAIRKTLHLSQKVETAFKSILSALICIGTYLIMGGAKSLSAFVAHISLSVFIPINIAILLLASAKWLNGTKPSNQG